MLTFCGSPQVPVVVQIEPGLPSAATGLAVRGSTAPAISMAMLMMYIALLQNLSILRVCVAIIPSKNDFMKTRVTKFYVCE
jgi:hypothetical protein